MSKEEVFFKIDGIEVKEDVAEKMRHILSIRVGRKVKNKELAEFIATLLQSWAHTMDTLIQKGGE